MGHLYHGYVRNNQRVYVMCVYMFVHLYVYWSHVPTVLTMSGLAVADDMAMDVARVTQDSQTMT